MQTIKIVPIAILIPFKKTNDDYSLWVQKRNSNDNLSNLLEFPGGKIETNETPAMACVREVKEEVGLEVNLDSLVLFQSYFFEEATKTLNIHVFLLDDTERSLFGQEGYFPQGDLISSPAAILPNNQRVIKDLSKYFQEFR